MSVNNPDSEWSESAEAHALRGRHLGYLGRDQEALTAFRAALLHDPHNPDRLKELAWCQLRSDAGDQEALTTIDQAIERRPLDPQNHVLRSLVLSQMDRGEEALTAAERAIGLDPDESLGHTARAEAFMRLRNWSEAEAEARMALTVDPEEGGAATILAHALFCQGKRIENENHVAWMLLREPEEATIHHAGGLAALQSGDHLRTETHFREALRLDPGFDPAREGLMEAYRARSVVYRSFLRMAFSVSRAGPVRLRVGWGLVAVVAMVLALVTSVWLEVAMTLVGIAFLLVVWSHASRALGTLMVLGDAEARRAIRGSERTEGLVAGSGVIAGNLAAGGGLLAGELGVVALGAALLCAVMPYVLWNGAESRRGRKIFGSLATGGGLAVVGVLLHLGYPNVTILGISLSVSLVVFMLGASLATSKSKDD